MKKINKFPNHFTFHLQIINYLPIQGKTNMVLLDYYDPDPPLHTRTHTLENKNIDENERKMHLVSFQV